MKTLSDQQQVVIASLRRPSELDGGEREEMLKLMDGYYCNVNRDNFVRELEAKDWVILLNVEQSGRLAGFSSQRLVHGELQSAPVLAIFSGDTIVAREFWKSPTLAQAWGRFAVSMIDQAGTTPLYWLLLSKGYRTYRFLPLFFRTYAPALGVPVSAELQAVRQTLMQQLYGPAFNPHRSIIDGVAINNYSLREGVADIDEARSKDPRIRFFAACNPSHAAGDELCCIAPITRANFTAAARRVIGVKYFE